MAIVGTRGADKSGSYSSANLSNPAAQPIAGKDICSWLNSLAKLSYLPPARTVVCAPKDADVNSQTV